MQIATNRMILMMSIAMLSGQLYAAAQPTNTAPKQKQTIQQDIQGGLINLLAALKELQPVYGENFEYLPDSLKSHEQNGLEALKKSLGDCVFGARHLYEQHQSIKQQPVIPLKNVHDGAGKVAELRQVKNEPKKALQSQVSGAAMSAASKQTLPLESKVKAESNELGVGADTLNLMKKSPQFTNAMKISHKIGRLVGLSSDKSKRAKFVSPKREVTGIEVGLLRMFNNASNNNLHDCVEYLKSLIIGKSLLTFHGKIGFVETVKVNALVAVQEMDIKQSDQLDLLLEDLVKRIQ